MADLRLSPFILQESPTPEGENITSDSYPGLVLVLAIFMAWILVRHFVAKRRTR